MKKGIFPGLPKEGLQFLRSLKGNNNREWFQNHKSIYKTQVKQPMESLIEFMATEFQRFAPEMVASPKTSAYRIHLDTTFSKDKSTYNTHVVAIFSRT